ncbi:MAG: FAD:protein FMN transferase [Gemmatimonadetes bacterium]|nr:FAD:protein FMN transferase [Gemmatimonadota bacterium]MBL0179861.1 FAD:protein FMN transferase [Gemmatimonadota bacterium]
MAIILTAILKLHGAPVVAQGGGHEYRQLHLGMEVRLVLHADQATADAAARAAFGRIAALEQLLSDWRPTSEVRQLTDHPGAWQPVSAELFEVLARAVAMSRTSGGAFDPTVGPLVALWREARRTGVAPPDSAIRRARRVTGWRLIGLDSLHRRVRIDRPGMRIDLGGIAKGWILGEARTTLRAHGVTAMLLEAGGDLLLGDAPPGRPGWEVSVPTPHGDSTLVLHDVAVSTSGPSAQHVVISGVAYSHVIDPRSGRPLTTAFETTVLHRDPATADALSTTITVLGPTRGLALARRLGGIVVTRR